MPLTFDAERPAPRSAPPTLDQHGAGIIAELGFGADAAAPLAADER